MADDRADEKQQEEPGLLFGRTREAWEKFWDKELTAETKRNRDWRRAADRIVNRYLDNRKDRAGIHRDRENAFRVNLFYSNTFTLQSFLYGRIPEVDCSRRFADSNDDQARVAANILERMLNTSIESDGGDFSAVLRNVLQDNLVPGLGQTRVRYEMATTETIVPEVRHPMTGEVISEARTEEQLLYEDVPVDYVPWRTYRWGYGRVWKDVSWQGYDLYMTRKEVKDRFGSEIARNLTYQSASEHGEDKDMRDKEKEDPARTACVTEIWYRDVEAVFWYSEADKVLCGTQEDPLKLPGFFASPMPMIANVTTSLQLPRPYFSMAEDLYNEVDELSTRINIITRAVKVVGVCDKTTPELRTMFESTVENTLVGVDNWAMLAEKGGMKGVIEFYPIQDVVGALDKLRQMRAEAIDLLYQVTGLADIMRGGGEKYEGVGKAELKAKFGSVRVQYLQEEFARIASETLTLKAQVIAKHFEPQTIIAQSNVQRTYDANLLGPAIELIKSSELPWRVTVKPESMAMVDWAKLQAERTEFINALALFMQSAAPLVQFLPGSMPVLLELLKWGLAGFKGSEEIESVLDKAIEDLLKAPPQGEEDGEPDKEMQKMQAKMAENEQKFNQDMMKQADKAQKELEKIMAQFRAKVAEIKAETQSNAIGEIIQADQAIREEREKAKLRPVR